MKKRRHKTVLESMTGADLEVLRNGKGWTTAQLAEVLCVSQRTVQRWEAAKTKSIPRFASKLCELIWFPGGK